MQVTIDSTEPLDRVLPVINALYGVSLSLPGAAEPAATKPAQARSSRTARTQQRSSRRNKHAEVTASAVREWARITGHHVSSRGRVASEVVEAYRAAH
jgi:hypothetical protein